MSNHTKVFSLTHRHGHWPVVIAFLPHLEALERAPWYGNAMRELERRFYERGEKAIALKESFEVMHAAVSEWQATQALASALEYEAKPLRPDMPSLDQIRAAAKKLGENAVPGPYTVLINPEWKALLDASDSL